MEGKEVENAVMADNSESKGSSQDIASTLDIHLLSENAATPSLSANMNAQSTPGSMGEIAADASKNTGNNPEVIKLNDKSRKICDQLQRMRQNLQNGEDQVGSKKKVFANNDAKALQSLHNMYNVSSSPLPTPLIQNPVNRQAGATGITNAAMASALKNYSVMELESIVVGLQELVTKLIADDSSLKSKAALLASDINGLHNFPLFSDAASSCVKAQQKSMNNQAKGGNKGAGQTIKENPQTQFVNYINSIVAQCVGEDNVETCEKLKCRLSDLENLEAYAERLVQKGIGHIINEKIRVNRKNNRQAFIILSNDRDGVDAIITSPVARRYAFEGDTVRAFVTNRKTTNQDNRNDDRTRLRTTSANLIGGKDNSISLEDDDDSLCCGESSPDTDVEDNSILFESTAVVSDDYPKAFVIQIVEQTEKREVVGSISFKNTTLLNSKSYYKLRPHDMKIPMLYVEASSCQEHVKSTAKEDMMGILYVAEVLEIDTEGYCIGRLCQPVGRVGDLQAELKAILLHNGLKDLQPYDEKFLKMFEGPATQIGAEELSSRQDMRNVCVFTIDPLTARDLDDAVSVEKLSESQYEIGVHISDVAHYLLENSELDNLVKMRATSIYLVNEVIHMLPESLCFRCSLLPGEDKFAFSVFWRWDADKGVLSEPRFTRSVINSCSQLAYEHAQKIIDNPNESFTTNDLPDIFNNWTTDDIKWRILLLHSVSKTLKAKRYEAGALSINNPKLRFSLNPVTGEPVQYQVEERKEANFLIEELMLLANQAVAKFIYQHFPDKSFLRNHSPPLQKSLRNLKERLSTIGLTFDVSSSKSIYESIQRVCSQASDPEAVEACLNAMLTKPMARARYFCSEGKTAETDFWHYALSIPIYTHFTSPIRRYPDILVHRLLAAALNCGPLPNRTCEELHELARVCNEQKFNAKNAGDESIDHFFVRYIRAKESVTLRAVITDIFKHMVNVVTVETGHAFALNYKMQKVPVDTTGVPSYIVVGEKSSGLYPVKLQVFSTVSIKVVLRNNKTCAFLQTPDKLQRRVNSHASTKQVSQKPNARRGDERRTRTYALKTKHFH